MNAAARRVLDWLDALENALIALLALSLAVLAGAQIVMRLADQGLVWLDPVLRVLVLWVGLLGAVAAARKDKHINLDVIGRLLSGRPLAVARFVTMWFAAAVCLLLVKSSLSLIALDRDSGTTVLTGIPMWWAELILPVAFSLLAVRFLLRSWVPEQTQYP